jgi:hypothetical protein
MADIVIKFSISIEHQEVGATGPIFGYTLGLRIENHHSVRKLAGEAGFDIVCHNVYPGREYVGIEVVEPPQFSPSNQTIKSHRRALRLQTMAARRILREAA